MFTSNTKIKKLSILNIYYCARIASSKKKSIYTRVKIALSNIKLQIKKSKYLLL